MEKKEIRILSRKSDLAQIQAKLVGFEINRKFPNIKIIYLTKKTEGDVDKYSPLSEMKTTGVFTEDLRKNLIVIKENKKDKTIPKRAKILNSKLSLLKL